MCENRELKEKCENIEKDYSIKLKEEIRKVENKYEDEIYQLEKENSFLRKVINTFQKTVDKFIHWVCNKFSVSSEEEFIRDFEFEMIFILIQKSKLNMRKNRNMKNLKYNWTNYVKYCIIELSMSNISYLMVLFTIFNLRRISS